MPRNAAVAAAAANAGRSYIFLPVINNSAENSFPSEGRIFKIACPEIRSLSEMADEKRVRAKLPKRQI